MRISIGKNTELAMRSLGIITYPFTVKELSSKFRSAMKKNHPEAIGPEHDFKQANDITRKIIEFYNHLKNLAISEVKESERESAKKILEEDEDMFSLWKTCADCGGKGLTPYIYTDMSICSKCYGQPNLTIMCRDCHGTGKFTLRNGKQISCRRCTGMGTFRRTCRYCGGRGWFGSGEERIKYIDCRLCKGVGKIKLNPFNPVIRKGSILI